MKTASRCSNMKVETIKRDGDKPKLRLKAAETRHLVPFAVELAVELHKAEKSEFSLIVLKRLRVLLAFYMCLGVAPFDYDQAKAAADECLLLYSSLSERAVLNRTPLIAECA
jgi:hypothetical protein